MSYLKNYIPFSGSVFYKRGEASAEAEVLLPDYYPPVMRIIRAEAVPFVRSKTVYGEKLVLEGNVEFRVLYQAESGDLNSFFYKAPFSHSAELSDVSVTPEASADIGFKDVRALSPQKLSLRASVFLSVSAPIFEERAVLSENGKDGKVATLTKTETFCRQTSKSAKNIRQSGEISLEKRPTMSRIIRYDAFYSDSDFKPMGKKTLVRTDLTLRLLYITPDSKTPASLEEKTVISQTFDVEIPDGNATAVIRPKLADCRFDLKEDAEGKVTAVEYTAETDVTLSVCKEEELTVITDAFGVGSEVETEKQNVLYEKIIPQRQNVTFEETADVGAFTEIYDVSARVAATEAKFDKENNLSEYGGEFLVNILYSDPDGETVSTERKLPFALKRETQENCAAVRQDLDVEVSSVKFSPSDGKISLSVECSVSGAIFVSEERTVITAITESEKKKEKDDSDLVLYYAKKGERLWDIAKRYGTPPERISEENGMETETVEEERMLFIPKFI